MRLGIRLGALYLAALVIFIFAVVSASATLGEMERKAHAARRSESVVGSIRNVRAAIDEAVRTARLAAADPSLAAAADSAALRADRLVVGLGSMVDDHERPALEIFAADWQALHTNLSRMRERPQAATRIFDELLPVLNRSRSNLQALAEARRDAAAHRTVEIESIIRSAREQLLVHVLLVGVIGLFLLYEVRFRILVPIRSLVAGADRVAAGDLTHRVEKLPRDELGNLGSRFNRMTERLEEAERAKMEFLSMVSHEMRTPLTSMGGFTSLLLSGRRGEITEKQKQALIIIEHENQRLRHLVDDLLDATRAEAGKFGIDPQPTRIPEVLEPLMIPYARQAEEAKVALTYRFADLPEAILDGKRIGQAVRNLVSNAFKYTPAGGRIAVEGMLEGDDLVFTVSDTGDGIPEESLARLFDKFYQAPTNPDKREGGVGLGLAIVRAIAREHGGDVDVRSELGRGTTFRIRIPCKRAGE